MHYTKTYDVGYRNISGEFNLSKLKSSFILFVFIFYYDINALTQKILYHRYFSICDKTEPMYILLEFFKCQPYMEKTTVFNADGFKWKKNKTKDLIHMKNWLNDWHLLFGTDPGYQMEEPTS